MHFLNQEPRFPHWSPHPAGYIIGVI